jgi:hypothetical protein
VAVPVAVAMLITGSLSFPRDEMDNGTTPLQTTLRGFGRCTTENTAGTGATALTLSMPFLRRHRHEKGQPHPPLQPALEPIGTRREGKRGRGVRGDIQAEGEAGGVDGIRRVMFRVEPTQRGLTTSTGSRRG